MSANPAPSFGAIIIGDELLSGRREDKHLGKVLELLKARGLRLASVRYVGDERPRLVQTLRESFASGDIVFSFGGIGATPTTTPARPPPRRWACRWRCTPRPRPRSAPASATRSRPSACRWASTRWAPRSSPTPSTASRLLDPQPLLRARLSGDGLADGRMGARPALRPPAPQADYTEQSVIVGGVRGQAHRPDGAITADFPESTLFSLPSFGTDTQRRHVELGMKAPPAGWPRRWPASPPSSPAAATNGSPARPSETRLCAAPSAYRDFPGRRWLGVLLRAAHLAGVVGVGAGLLAGGGAAAALFT
jgi:hypothetical protein